MSKYNANSSPFATEKISQQAKDFVKKAVNNLLPWIKDHYYLHYLADQARDSNTFDAISLYDFHLNGDYVQDSTEGSRLNADQQGKLSLTNDPPRLVNVPSTHGKRYGNGTIVELTDRITNYQLFLTNPVTGISNNPQIGIDFAKASLTDESQFHYLTREITSGSSILNFLFAEQASIIYNLLPVVDNFQEKTANFLTNEAAFFIENSRDLMVRSGRTIYGCLLYTSPSPRDS